MAANGILLFLLLISTISSTKAQQKNTNIVLGSSLSPTQNPHWPSDSGLFAFGFYPNDKGFAVGVWFTVAGVPPQRTVVWTANRDDPPLSGDASLLLTTDGRLVLKQSLGEEIKFLNASMAATSASMLDSGNFVLYNSDSEIIWQSFDFPTTTILPGQSLKAGQELVSGVTETNQETGKFRIMMQNDGNLVQYPVETSPEPDDAYWSTGTFTAGDNVSLNLDSSGNLYLLNTTGFKILNLYDRRKVSDGAFFRLTMDVDGIFRLYSFDQNRRWVIEWSSSTNKCDPIGLCGLNSYCALGNQGPVCVCPPGFDFIDQADKNVGCTANFSTGACLSKKKLNKNKEEEEKMFDVEELDAIDWEDNPYSIVSSTVAECKKDCLRDCNCEAAIFKHLECRKQKLPLRFGRIQRGQQVITMIKVGTTTLIKGKTQLRMDIFITGVAFLITGLIVLAISGGLIYRYKVWKYTQISTLEKEGFAEDVNLQKFTYSELEKATNGFSDEVGEGASGTVFKGTISKGKRIVAIKRLEKAVIEGDESEFLNQIKVIGRTHHKNLVRLLGYCHDQTNKLLVYEFMSNGTLADAIFRSEKKPNWEERKNMALNIARGILYLHEECPTQIIHRNINPENILIGERGSVKIADFGLPKLLNPQQFTKSRTYMAPEWHRNMPITVKSDVYSFGITLLEIVCCRRSVVDMDVLNWVYDCLEGNKVEKEKVERLVKVGLWCIQDEPNFRPGMKKVVMMLKGTVEIPPPPCPVP